MVFSKRERLLAIALGSALGLLAFDRYALTPYLGTRAELAAQTETVTRELESAHRLLSNRRRVQAAWDELAARGLRSDPAEAESQALHALRDWAQAARVDLQSIKPERAPRARDFQEIRIHATGTGSTAAMTQMLWRIESARIPLRINELRISSRKDGSDDLAFQLSLSTVAFVPQTEPAPGEPAGGQSFAGITKEPPR